MSVRPGECRLLSWSRRGRERVGCGEKLGWLIAVNIHLGRFFSTLMPVPGSERRLLLLILRGGQVLLVRRHFGRNEGGRKGKRGKGR